jgi:hypothetical protein
MQASHECSDTGPEPRPWPALPGAAERTGQRVLAPLALLDEEVDVVSEAAEGAVVAVARSRLARQAARRGPAHEAAAGESLTAPP